MITRLQILFSEDELNALQQLANEEMRELRNQIRFVIHQDLKRRGHIREFRLEGSDRETDAANKVPVKICSNINRE